MPRDPLWIILDPDGDIDGYERGATLKDAARTLYGPDEDLTGVSGIRVNADIRRLWRNARRREWYAHRRDCGPGHKSRARPAPEGFVFDLSYSADMAIHDVNGRCRCPTCNRFCIRADFAGSPTSISAPGLHVSFGPSCWRCRGMERAPYDGWTP